LNLRLANSYSGQRAAALSPSAGARGILAEKMGKPEEAEAQLQLVSNIRKVYEANGASMDPEILQMMEKAGIERVGS
jgi:hypothetical protein